MAVASEIAPTAGLERAMREWISATSLQANFLSRVKGMRDHQLLLRFNALTNEPADVALAKTEQIVQEVEG
ncbi:hypothetical protein ACUVZD_000179 [Pseudomonas aeruginosa]